jgi:hypothetical protein
MVKVPEDWPLHDPASFQVPEIELGLLTVAVLLVPVLAGMLICASEPVIVKVKLFPTMSFVLPLGVTPTVPDTEAPLTKHELVGLSAKLLPLKVAVMVVTFWLLLVLFCVSTTVKDETFAIPEVVVNFAVQVPFTLALVPVLSPHALSMTANPTANAVKNRLIIPNLFNFCLVC